MRRFEDHLNCKKCKNIYDNPVIIECGETICKKCLIENIEINMNEFTCPLCFQIHQMPKNGFPLNKAFIELIQDISIDKINEINKDQFDKSINIEYLKFNLKNLKMEIDKIDSMIKNPSDELYEYCANLKREVQLSTEIKIENMNKLNDQFIKQIDEFEKKCSKNMKTEIKVDLNKMQQQNVSFNEFYKCAIQT